MTSRERVRRALEFKNPDRAPRDLWALPAVELFQKQEYEALLERFPLDIGKPYFSPGQSSRASGNYMQVGRYVDDWGSVWELAEAGVVGEVKQPALEDWSALRHYQPPWEIIRDRNLGPVNESCRTSDKFMLSDCCARPFERMQFVRGSEQLFLDLAERPPEFEILRQMVHEFNLEDVRAWCATEVDGIMMMDDWGTQFALLIAPDQWREVFKPMYREYCALARAAGKFTFFHTDGHVEAIYGDLIEAGMNAVNSQLFCMDIESLAAKYRGRVTFWGEIDRQHILPFGTPDEVRASVRRVRDALDDGRGGLIAQCEWGKHNPPENVAAVYEEWAAPRPS